MINHLSCTVSECQSCLDIVILLRAISHFAIIGRLKNAAHIDILFELVCHAAPSFVAYTSLSQQLRLQRARCHADIRRRSASLRKPVAGLHARQLLDAGALRASRAGATDDFPRATAHAPSLGFGTAHAGFRALFDDTAGARRLLFASTCAPLRASQPRHMLGALTARRVGRRRAPPALPPEYIGGCARRQRAIVTTLLSCRRRRLDLRLLAGRRRTDIVAHDHARHLADFALIDTTTVSG